MSRDPSSRRRRRARQPEGSRAYQKPLATEYSRDPELSDPIYLVRTIKALPQIWTDLQSETTPAYAGGRRRSEGSYALLYLAFLCSDVIDVKTWCDRWATSEVWSLAGFDERPNFRSVWLRFTELERYSEAFEHAAQKLIQQAMRHDEKVGRHIHVDGTHFTTHARLVHCCPNPVACQALWRRPGGLKPAKALTKAADDLIKAERHKASAEPEPAAGTAPPQLASVLVGDPRLKHLDESEVARHAFFELGGHLYKTRDLTAGVRHFPKRERKKERFTEGGQLLMGTCDYIGAPVAVHATSVGVQEWDAYPALWAKVEAACGERPEAMVTDRGYHVVSVFEHNTRRSVSTIAPWRQPRPGIFPEDLECARFDRHGVVRCRHCGAPTHQNAPGLGLYFDGRGEPRLRVECSLQHTEECKRPQSIACSEEWRLLQPINRTDELYHNLLHANKNKEGLFHHWRRRYAVAGNAFAERPKRRQSVTCQALRAAAGLLVEWLRICIRHGWLGSHRRRNETEPVERDCGRRYWREVWELRRDLDLDLVYGPAAADLGFIQQSSSPAERAKLLVAPEHQASALKAPPPRDPNDSPF
jgi:hypothetical protein